MQIRVSINKGYLGYLFLFFTGQNSVYWHMVFWNCWLSAKITKACYWSTHGRNAGKIFSSIAILTTARPSLAQFKKDSCRCNSSFYASTFWLRILFHSVNVFVLVFVVNFGGASPSRGSFPPKYPPVSCLPYRFCLSYLLYLSCCPFIHLSTCVVYFYYGAIIHSIFNQYFCRCYLVYFCYLGDFSVSIVFILSNLCFILICFHSI